MLSQRTGNVISRRLFATESSVSAKIVAAPTTSASPTTIKQSSTENGVRLLTIDTHNPLSGLSMVLPLGSKYESGAERGAAHFLKNFVFKVRK